MPRSRSERKTFTKHVDKIYQKQTQTNSQEKQTDYKEQTNCDEAIN